MSDNIDLKNMDYTQPCIDILNRIINFSHFIPIIDRDTVAVQSPRLWSAVGDRWSTIWRIYDGAPREVYEYAFEDQPETVKSVELKWAITWAKSAGILGHHGPAGTHGWVLYRSNPIQYSEVGAISPFNVQDLSEALSEAMRFSNALRAQEFKRQQDAISKANKVESELRAERQKQKLSTQFTWS